MLALSLTLLAICVLTVWLYRRSTRNAEAYATITGKGYRPRVMDLGRWRYAPGNKVLFVGNATREALAVTRTLCGNNSLACLPSATTQLAANGLLAGTYQACVDMFRRDIPWLTATDREWILGKGLAECLRWPEEPAK